ncbi:hypothetical protein CAPTEDRAFT_52512, partial [Capitella teleta]
DRATSPMNQQEDVETVLSFCDQINKELEGPQISVRLMAHKIQSPQEREALYALGALETCVRNCGKRFHSEIGKFRFLNEVIKVVSPKYLGNYTSEKVKKRCIELLFRWSKSLPHEPKIAEAFSMLKKQGIVKEDPVLPDETLPAVQPEERRNTVFEDDEKSKTLARLLRSKHPEDLQAANRLIKNMVKQDAERLEKVSKRVQQIETVGNNVKLLMEMLAHHQPGNSSESDRDIMKELYDNLEKQRPNLFRLASDTDDKDDDGINAILKCNDAVLKVMTDYKTIVEGNTEHGSLISMETESSNQGAMSDLFSLEADYILSSSPLHPPPLPPPPSSSASSGPGGYSDPGLAAASASVPPTESDLTALDDIFSSAASAPTSNNTSVRCLMLCVLCFTLFVHSQSLLDLGASANLNSLQFTSSSTVAPPTQPPLVVPSQAPSLMDAFSSHAPPSLPSYNSQSLFTTASAPAAQPIPPPPPSSAGMKELDVLGQSLLQQSLSSDKAKVPMNQMLARTSSSSGDTTLLSAISPSPTPPVMASPAKKPATVVEPLTDIFVALQSIQPGSEAPITPYDRNGLKVVVHFAKDKPRDDVSVMVISIMSTNSSPVKNVSFQVAVPKVMKVKLQPPSATDLPAFNPILPPAAITQVMLIANPQKESIRAKFKLVYVQDMETKTDVGEIDNIP